MGNGRGVFSMNAAAVDQFEALVREWPAFFLRKRWVCGGWGGVCRSMNAAEWRCAAAK